MALETFVDSRQQDFNEKEIYDLRNRWRKVIEGDINCLIVLFSILTKFSETLAPVFIVIKRVAPLTSLSFQIHANSRKLAVLSKEPSSLERETIHSNWT